MSSTARLQTPLTLLTILVLAACGGGEEDQLYRGSEPGRLAGIWTAELAVSLPLISHPDTTTRVRGSIALIPNNRVSRVPGAGWAPTHLGTTDLDFRPFGFEMRPTERVPGIFARLQLPDSVWLIVDPPHAGESLRLDGRLAGDSVTGLWRYDSRQGGAAGTFVLRRRGRS